MAHCRCHQRENMALYGQGVVVFIRWNVGSQLIQTEIIQLHSKWKILALRKFWNYFHNIVFTHKNGKNCEKLPQEQLCHNLSFYVWSPFFFLVLSQFKFLSYYNKRFFVFFTKILEFFFFTIWVVEFCQKSFQVLSQFEFWHSFKDKKNVDKSK